MSPMLMSYSNLERTQVSLLERTRDSRISGRISGQDTARIFDFWM